MPNNGIEIIKAEAAADDADVGVEGNDSMTSGVLAAGPANVANDTHQAATGNENAKNFPPCSFQFLYELLVVGYVTELALGIVIPLKRPVWG